MESSDKFSNLELDTGLLTSPAGSTVKLSFTFSINLRTILGDNYDKYDEFAISLNAVSGNYAISNYVDSTGTALIVPNAPIATSVAMEGLNWKNFTFNGRTSTIAYFPNKVTFPVVTTPNFTANFPNAVSMLFIKPKNPNVTLTMYHYYVSNNAQIYLVNAAANIEYDYNYAFTINGVK